MAKDDDEAWRAIIDNYGDRPEITEEPVDPAASDATSEPSETSGPDTWSVPNPVSPSWDDDYPDNDWSSDRFVPPEPPPIPQATTDRLAAWLGIFGSPAILLVCLIFGIDLPEFLAYLLVASFIGGFLYLVIKMPREPRDPGDNGAVL